MKTMSKCLLASSLILGSTFSFGSDIQTLSANSMKSNQLDSFYQIATTIDKEQKSGVMIGRSTNEDVVKLYNLPPFGRDELLPVIQEIASTNACERLYESDSQYKTLKGTAVNGCLVLTKDPASGTYSSMYVSTQIDRLNKEVKVLRHRFNFSKEATKTLARKEIKTITSSVNANAVILSFKDEVEPIEFVTPEVEAPVVVETKKETIKPKKKNRVIYNEDGEIEFEKFCSLDAEVIEDTWAFMVGGSKMAGIGEITCVDNTEEGATEVLPVKVTGRGAGWGLIWERGVHASLNSISIGVNGPITKLLGKYTAPKFRAAAFIGGVSFGAGGKFKNGGVILPMGVLKKSSGLGAHIGMATVKLTELSEKQFEKEVANFEEEVEERKEELRQAAKRNQKRRLKHKR